MSRKKPNYCGRHRIDFYHHGFCPACVDASLNKLERVKKAWRAINKWVAVERFPEEHPLQQLKRALRARPSQR